MEGAKRYLEKGTEIVGRKGKYTIGEWINQPNFKRRESKYPSGYTPTTLSARLHYPRPQLYEAFAKNGHRFAIKVALDPDREQLELEATALKKLANKCSHFGPSLHEDIQSDINQNGERVYFIVIEWLDPQNWISLTDLISQYHPILNQALDDHGKEKKARRLELLLTRAISEMHHSNIVHGDLKPEHIFVSRENENASPNFKEIRVIDYGFSYQDKLSKYKGGSQWFSNPALWNSHKENVLGWNSLCGIDEYAIYAILFYALYGEYFPIASPAYREFVDREFYGPLRTRLISQTRLPIEREVIENLCSTQITIRESQVSQRINALVQILECSYIPLLWLLFILSGAIGFTLRSQAKGLSSFISILIIILALFVFIYYQRTQNNKEEKYVQQFSLNYLIYNSLFLILSWILIKLSFFITIPIIPFIFSAFLALCIFLVPFLNLQKRWLALALVAFLGPFFLFSYSIFLIPILIGVISKKNNPVKIIALIASLIMVWLLSPFTKTYLEYSIINLRPSIFDLWGPITLIVWIAIGVLSSVDFKEKDYSRLQIRLLIAFIGVLSSFYPVISLAIISKGSFTHILQEFGWWALFTILICSLWLFFEEKIFQKGEQYGVKY